MILLVRFARKRRPLCDRENGIWGGLAAAGRPVSAMIDDMIAAGEFEATSFCSHWAKPSNPTFKKS